LFLFVKQTNPKPVKQEVNSTVILPPLVLLSPLNCSGMPRQPQWISPCADAAAFCRHRLASLSNVGRVLKVFVHAVVRLSMKLRPTIKSIDIASLCVTFASNRVRLLCPSYCEFATYELWLEEAKMLSLFYSKQPQGPSIPNFSILTTLLNDW